MINNRFSDAPWIPQKEEKVLIGGAGGIGSWLTFFMCRAGFKPYVFDDDIVEEHNIGGQLFQKRYIGRPKVEALRTLCYDFCDTTIDSSNTRITRENPVSHYYSFSCFDNMKARRIMFDNWKSTFSKTTRIPILIDGRLLAEQLQIFCVTPQNADRYEDFLFSDDEIEDAPCTFKQTSHVAAMIASHMFAFFTNHITNMYEGEFVRDVPFFYEFYTPVSLTNIET